jgi:hypothetical protein
VGFRKERFDGEGLRGCVGLRDGVAFGLRVVSRIQVLLAVMGKAYQCGEGCLSAAARADQQEGRNAR